MLCSAEQAPYITGEKKPLRLTLTEEQYERTADPSARRALEEEMDRLRGLQTVERVTVMPDGGALPDFGVQLIEVSGHMPGHLCVWIEREKTLVAGDALIIQGRTTPAARRTVYPRYAHRAEIA